MCIIRRTEKKLKNVGKINTNLEPLTDPSAALLYFCELENLSGSRFRQSVALSGQQGETETELAKGMRMFSLVSNANIPDSEDYIPDYGKNLRESACKSIVHVDDDSQ